LRLKRPYKSISVVRARHDFIVNGAPVDSGNEEIVLYGRWGINRVSEPVETVKSLAK